MAVEEPRAQFRVIGVVVWDPKVGATARGTSYCNFLIGRNYAYTDKETGDAKTGQTKYPISVWGKRAEELGASLSKNMYVLVEGELRVKNYDADEHRTDFELIGESVLFLGGGPMAQSRGTAPPDNAGTTRDARDAQPVHSDVAPPDDDESSLPF